MFPVGSKLRQVIFSQPERIRHRREAQHRFHPPPQAGSLISLMYALKPGSPERMTASYLKGSSLDRTVGRNSTTVGWICIARCTTV